MSWRSQAKAAINCVWALMLAICAEAVAAVHPTIGPVVRPGRASETLQILGKQADIMVLWPPSDMRQVRRARTRGLDGTRALEQAIPVMLAGTDLEYELHGRTLTIRAKPAAPRLSEITVMGREQALGLATAAIQMQGNSPFINDPGVLLASDLTHRFTFTNQQACDGPDDLTREARSNAARACGISIHGLPPRATLVLINDERVAPSGTNGLFGSTAHIPLSAIANFVIVSDDAATAYGADALGGIASFTLRSDFDGFETQAKYVPPSGGAVEQHELSQVAGLHWGAFKGLALLEYDQRDAIWASQRPQVTSNLDRWGGTNYDTPLGSPGTVFVGTVPYALRSVPPGTPLTPADFISGKINLFDFRAGSAVQPSQTLLSLLLAGHLDLDGGSKLSADLLLSRRLVQSATGAVGLPATITDANPYYTNPAGGHAPEQIYIGFQDSFGHVTLHANVWNPSLAFGADLLLDTDWRLKLALGYAAERLEAQVGGLVNAQTLDQSLLATDPSQAFDPYQEGVTKNNVLEAIRGYSLFGSHSDSAHVNVTAQGSLHEYTGTGLAAKVGLDFRRESLRSYQHASGVTPDVTTNVARFVHALFTEICLPLLGDESQCVGTQSVEKDQLLFTAAGRYEHYSDAGGTIAPTFRALWSISQDIAIAASWSRPFDMGSLTDHSEINNTITSQYIPGAYAPVLLATGGNSSLRPERAEDVTLTATFQPRSFQGLFAEVRYFHDDYRDRIDEPSIGLDALSNPSDRELVTLDPTPPQQAAFCSHGVFSGPSTPCQVMPVAAILDGRLRNLTRLTVSGFDFALAQALGSPVGKWLAALHGTYMSKYTVHDADTRSELVNTLGYPLRLRTIGSLSWTLGSCEAIVFVNYTGSYRDVTSQPNRRIDDLTTFDLQLSFDFPHQISHIKTLRVSIGVHDLLNSSPPFANNGLGIGYDVVNFDQRGRFGNVSVKAGW
jgi:iron complex outermembrane receptor protein